MPLFNNFKRKIENENLIKKNDVVIVGFSGGPDSVFMTEMLLKLKTIADFEIILVHINHLFRGDEALADENFSIEYGKKNGVKVYTKQINILELSKKKKKSFEEVGREERYKFFDEIFLKENATKIALAHNKDDQVENFLFRMIRGSGIEGLKGIETRGKYIRPINHIYKKDILEYLDKNQISYCIDKTNFENEYTRNSIRLDLIPFIENRYNSRFKDKIFDLLGEIKEINNYFERKIENYIKDNSIQIDEIQKLDSYLKSRVLVKFLTDNGIEVSRKKIKLIEGILSNGGSQQLNLKENILLIKEYNKIFIKEKKNSILSDEMVEKELVLKDFDTIEFGEYIIEISFSEIKEKNKDCFYTTLSKGDKIKIRYKKDGDRIIPTGMKGEKKVKEILINEKIPKERRDKLPLILYNDEIVWIGSVRGSEKYCQKDSNKSIKFTIRRKTVER